MKRAADRNTFLSVGIAIFLLGVFGFGFVAGWPPEAPSYQGKSLNHWLEQHESDHWNVVIAMQADGTCSLGGEEAKDALRHIGTNALPTLIRMIRSRDSRLKQLAMKWSSKQSLIQFTFTPAITLRAQAVGGYEILASSARAQVPELSQILTNDDLAGVRQSAALVLGCIGPDAKSAASGLLITAKDKEVLVRCSSFWALSRIDADPDLVLPGLIEGLDDTFANTRQFAALALAKYGPRATSAIPALLRTMATNREAHRALLAIDPNAASGLESK